MPFRFIAVPVYAVIAGVLAVVALATDAKATVIGFNIHITATTSAPGFGTGVVAGDMFQGLMFYDDADPAFLPAPFTGMARRTIIPGGHSLVIAGIDLSAFLSEPFLGLGFSAGQVVCLGGLGPCGSSSALTNNIQPLFFQISDDLTGVVGDNPSNVSFTFDYGLSPRSPSVPVPEPSALWLFCFGLAGLVFARWRFSLRRWATRSDALCHPAV